MTNEIKVINENGKLYTTSLNIAEVFGKEHRHVLRDIKELGCTEEFRRSNFGQSFYFNLQGKQQPMYYVSKDGLLLLVMGYTGKKAMEIKMAFIKRFNEMEEQIKSVIGSKKQLNPIDKSIKGNKAFKSHYSVSKLIFPNRNQALLSANNATKRMTGIDVLGNHGVTCLVAEKKEKTLTPTQIGQELGGFSAIKVNRLLCDKGFQIRVGTEWIPTEKGKPFCELLDTGKERSSGSPIKQIKWYTSVIEKVAHKKETAHV